MALGANFTTGARAAKFGTHEVVLTGDGGVKDPFDTVATVQFMPPSGAANAVTVKAFFDGENTWRARVYVTEVGEWRWATSCLSDAGLNDKSGKITAVDSALRGLLKKHKANPRAWMTDDERWFVSISDTAWLLFNSDPRVGKHWKQYVQDDAAKGINVLGPVGSLESWGTGDVAHKGDNEPWVRGDTTDHTRYDLAKFHNAESRLIWIFDNHPGMYVQSMLFGTQLQSQWSRLPESVRTNTLDYLIARWSAFPNVFWLISEDQDVTHKATLAFNREVGEYFAAHEPWKHLISTQPNRFQGFPFATRNDLKWVSYIEIQDADAPAADQISKHKLEGIPLHVMLGEDYYEQDYGDPPSGKADPRYYYRWTFWSWILSGGSANYGGRYGVIHPYSLTGKPDLAWTGPGGTKFTGHQLTGLDSVPHILPYFEERKIDLAYFNPKDTLVSDADGQKAKQRPKLMQRGRDEFLVYHPNAGSDGNSAKVNKTKTARMKIDLTSAPGPFEVEWFRPYDGVAQKAEAVEGGAPREFEAPWKGYDVVLRLHGPASKSKPLDQEANTWVKRSPLKEGPLSPGMGYETSLGYDPRARKVIRWGGHNQGGGGEQNAETWVYDPATAEWALREPNASPPGVCCAQQNVFDAVNHRFLRFAAFSGNHGWQWFREIYLNNSSVWSDDLAENTWRDMRALPAPRTGPLRCATWDSEHQVVVLFGGEGIEEGTLVYDPHTNAWTRMHPPQEPAYRSGGNMAYDAAHKLHILFGAQFLNDPHTWAYDLRKNEWRDLKPDAQPPTDRNDAVLAYDKAGKVVVALLRVIDREESKEVVEGHLETWAFDAGRNTWTHMKPAREPDGKGNRRRVMAALPDQDLLLLENYINSTERVPGVEREQQIWTYRFASARADKTPSPPTNVKAATTADAAILTWQANASPGVSGYKIYRGEGKQPWTTEYKEVGAVEKDQTSFRDKDLKRGVIYYYAVRALAGTEQSADSDKVRTQPHVVEDAVVSVIAAREARLSWTTPPDKDIAGYHVERAVVEVYSEDQITRLKKDTPPLAEPSVGAIKAIGAFSRLNKDLLREPVYTDTTLNLAEPQAIEGDPIYRWPLRADQLDEKGKPYRYAVYAYRIRAVNHLGVESGPSPFALTIPSAPQWLFSREDGPQCQLRWIANPEKDLKGYRVYRMEGPRINGPGQPVSRLTGEPIGDPRYADNNAGKDTRRYYVVAVDALGQEGFPSAPTWHYREYRRYYEPFVGEWHQ
jgi:hypothetical protein